MFGYGVACVCGRRSQGGIYVVVLAGDNEELSAVVELGKVCGVGAAELGAGEVSVHCGAEFGRLDVEGGDGGGGVDRRVYGDDGCAGGCELGGHGVHNHIDGSGLIACGAVEETLK